jgi:UDP-glucuronate 4-epimerase
LLKKPPEKNMNFNKNSPEPSKSWAPHQIFNIGNSNTIFLKDFIKSIEDELNMKALKEYLPMQLGDVKKTLADTNSLEKWINFKPKTNLKDGINKFILWYKDFYRIY